MYILLSNKDQDIFRQVSTGMCVCVSLLFVEQLLFSHLSALPAAVKIAVVLQRNS